VAIRPWPQWLLLHEGALCNVEVGWWLIAIMGVAIGVATSIYNVAINVSWAAIVAVCS
jgi:hypothetical protein